MFQTFSLLRWFHFVLDMLPVALGIWVLIRSATVFKVIKSKVLKLYTLGTFIGAFALVVAQTSWWISYALNNSSEGAVFSNLLWTAFNCLMMALSLVMINEYKNETNQSTTR